MCGIIAYWGSQPGRMWDRLYQGLMLIQNRGYDSAGLCAVPDMADKTDFIVHKSATPNAINHLAQFCDEYAASRVGIAHTRWATHGLKTDANAHPHIDSKCRFALVHNGIIENYLELKSMLSANGYVFGSATDTEVIVNLISYWYDHTNDVYQAISEAVTRLQGTWALAIITNLSSGHDSLYLCKNGSPLLLGFSDDRTEFIAASEVAGFSGGVTQYVALNNHDIIEINRDYQPNQFTYCKTVAPLQQHLMSSSPAPFEHWMFKEIYEQPQSLLRAINFGGRIESPTTVKLGGLDSASQRLRKIQNLVILGCGTSLHAGYYGAHLFRQLSCFCTVTCIDASEFRLSDLPNPNYNPGIIVLSQSGETKDVHRSMELIRQHDDNVPIISVVNAVDSLIAKEADCGVYLNAGREVAVASTKSFTSQCVVLTLIAIWFASHSSPNPSPQSLMIEALTNIASQCGHVLDHCRTAAQQLAQQLSNATSCFVLGRGPLHAIALEGALKLKEIGYIHAEGFCGGALKHGPFALIGPLTPVIVLIGDDDESCLRMTSAIAEIQSREAPVIIISNRPGSGPGVESRLQSQQIYVPVQGPLSSLLYVLIFQLTAYYMALFKGHSPDYPKNLAKVVTVDG